MQIWHTSQPRFTHHHIDTDPVELLGIYLHLICQRFSSDIHLHGRFRYHVPEHEKHYYELRSLRVYRMLLVTQSSFMWGIICHRGEHQNKALHRSWSTIIRSVLMPEVRQRRREKKRLNILSNSSKSSDGPFLSPHMPLGNRSAADNPTAKCSRVRLYWTSPWLRSLPHGRPPRGTLAYYSLVDYFSPR